MVAPKDPEDTARDPPTPPASRVSCRILACPAGSANPATFWKF